MIPYAEPLTRLNGAEKRHSFARSHCRERFRTHSETALEIARRMIGGSQPAGAVGDSSARAAAEACGHLYRELSRWVGPEGCQALFARAISEARTGHPALAQIQLRPRSDPYVEGVAESIMAHGDKATEAALESTVVIMVDLLRRLIGNDMANKLIERSLPPGISARAITDPQQEEA